MTHDVPADDPEIPQVTVDLPSDDEDPSLGQRIGRWLAPKLFVLLVIAITLWIAFDAVQLMF